MGRFLGPGNDIFRAVLALPHAPPPVWARGKIRVQVAPFVDYACDEHLRQEREEPGTTEAARACFAAANDAIGRLVGSAADPDFFDGAHGRPHAVFDAGAFECRASRARAGDQPVGIAQHRLPIGAHVDEQGEIGRLVHARAQHACGDVGADIAGYPR